MKEKVGALPPLPEAVAHILRILDDPKSSADDITNLVVRDVGAASKILQLVNSAYFGLANKVSDIKHAITLLGFNEVRSMLLAMGSFGLMSSIGAGRKGFQEMWRHFATCAMLCRLIARKRPGIHPEAAFAVGLFHDAGKLALMRFMPEEYKRVLAEGEKRGVSFLDSERTALDTDHAEIGQWMATKWQLPFQAAEAIGGHHSIERVKQDTLTATCYFADYICWLRGINCPGAFGTRTLDFDLWKSFGLDSDDLDDLAAKADIETELIDLIIETSGSGRRTERG